MNGMKLKTQVLLVGASAVVVCFCVSEVLTYRQAAEFFTEHERRIQQGGESEALLASFRQQKLSLLRELVALRLLSAVGAVTALLIALNLLWGRFVTRPVNMLLDRMNSMGRGGWTQPIPAERQDEIGRLIGEFNLLGPRLTFTAHQYAAAQTGGDGAIGQRVTRRTNVARRRIIEIQELMSEAGISARLRLRPQCMRLEVLRNWLIWRRSESEFNDELVRQGLPPRSITSGNRRASMADPRQDS